MAEYHAGNGDVVHMEWGDILVLKNELFFVAGTDDPPGVSFVANGPGRGLGKISWKTTKGGTLAPQQAVEIVLLQGKRRYDDINDITGEFYIGINDGRGADDANMIDVALVHHDGIECRVPISAPNFSAAAAPAPAPTFQWPNKIVSPDGRVELDIQNVDALNMVLYRDGVALWSVSGGLTPAGRALGWR